MKQYFILAWRNLWRNKRRTFLTLMSVMMSVLLAVAIRSVQKGAYGNMIKNAVSFSTGYAQVHAKGYWDDQSINNTFEWNDSLRSVFNADKNISLFVPRLESFVLASSGQHTKGVMISGIVPDKENSMNHLQTKIVQGSYFQHNDIGQGVIIGDGLAHYLHLKIGDTLVVLGQGYHGVTAAGQYRLQGIFHFPIEQLNNNLIYLNLSDAQQLFVTPQRLTSISLMLNNSNQLDNTVSKIKNQLSKDYEVMKWQVMNKSLVQEIQGDNAGGIIMLGILYLVVAFGVFGTVLMMTIERKKEFAVLIAIGMKRIQLLMMVIIEIVLICLMGIVSGIAVVFPFILWFHIHPIPLTGAAAKTYQQFGIEPILPASIDPSIFIIQGITVLCFAIFSAAYPIWYIYKLRLANTLKQ